MKVKVLQWNILYTEKPQNIVSLIQECKPDIFCLQELTIGYHKDISHVGQFIQEKTGFQCFFQSANPEGVKRAFPFGNGIFSRFPTGRTSHQFVQLPPAELTDYSHEGRVYLEADIEIEGKKITIATTHLSYIKKFEISQEKKEEVDKLLKIVSDKKEKYILTGDLNSLPDSYTIKGLSKNLKHCGPDYQEKTWTTKPFEYQGFSEDKLNWRLDYVFATPDMKCLSSEIVKTDYSDHLPILATFEI